VEPLPLAPSCALDGAGLTLQLDRYRRAGQGGRLIERTHRRFVVDLDDHVDGNLIGAAITIERECCPFFDLDWNPGQRRLTVSVSLREHEPALEAIAFALGLDRAAPADRPVPGRS
jgi:hypothetical protein